MRRYVLLLPILLLVQISSTFGHLKDRPSVHDTLGGIVNRVRMELPEEKILSMTVADAEAFLTEEEKETVKKTLKGEVEFKVDPGIMGGLVVRVGDKVLDGSVAGKLESMRQSVK